MRIITCLLLIAAFSLTSLAQKKKNDVTPIAVPELSYNSETKLITYEKVSEVAGTKDEVYARALAWLKSYYKNPADVIRNQDTEGGKIEGRARFRLMDENPETGAQTPAGNAQYDIIISCKDGRYKYEITNIGHKKQTFFPAEKWDEENKKAYTRIYASYLLQMDTELQEVIKSLNAAMTATPTEKKEEW